MLHRTVRRFSLYVACALLASCAPAAEEEISPPVESADTVRQLSAGEIIGYQAESSAHVWLGVPFAASTTSDNRWKAPRPVEPWSETRSAIEFAPACPQFSRDENTAGQLLGSEDCLYLNIYAPPNAQGKDLPVMLWIHGGGNVWGSADEYDASNLVVNENVIVVTVQYRLGPLGYFAHESIRETADTALDKAANFALLDLLASLEWVQTEIREFGGNPENVTIFGESAGGHNVAALLGSPLAKGLFHRAIIQSGGFNSVSLADAENRTGNFFNPSSVVVEKLGHGGSSNEVVAKALRDTSVTDFFGVYASTEEAAEARISFDDGEKKFPDIPIMITDGVTLPEQPLRSLFSSVDTFNAVPIITGTNRDELKLFFLASPDLIKMRFGLFPVPRNQEQYDLVAEYSSRLWRIHAVDDPAKQMAAAGHADVWGYRFDWDESGSILFTDFSKLFGAGHAMEIPFVFYNFNDFMVEAKHLFPEKYADSRNALGAAMGQYWASFARDGNPTSSLGPAWPRYAEEETAQIMRFDSERDAGIGVIKGADSIDSWIQDLVVDPRFSDSDFCLFLTEMGTFEDGNVVTPETKAKLDETYNKRCLSN